MYCNSVRQRPGTGTGTGSDSPAAARRGQGLSDYGRVRPGAHIGIRPAAAKSLCEKSAGCGFGCRFYLRCHALLDTTLLVVLVAKQATK
jgi:hypothetical protein